MVPMRIVGEIDESKIGGSDIYTILGLSSFMRPAHLAMRLRGDRIPADGQYGVMGHRAEPALLDWYADRMGVKVAEAPRFLNEWARATPDGEVTDPLTDEKYGVEVKFWEPTRRREFGGPMSDEVAIQCMVQCQWYMAWLNWDRMDVAVSFGNREPELYHLASHAPMQRRLIQLARAFYRRAMADGPLKVHGRLEAQRRGEPHFLGLPSLETMGKVRYLAKATRIEAMAGRRKKLAQSWAISHVGNQPGRIVTPEATVTIYRTQYGSLAVRTTSREVRA